MNATLNLDGKEVDVIVLEVIPGIRYGARCIMPSGATEMHVAANVRYAAHANG